MVLVFSLFLCESLCIAYIFESEGGAYNMELLKEILQEIEHEALTNRGIGRKQCEGMARSMNIVSSYISDDLNYCDTSSIECTDDASEDVPSVSKEFLQDCAETSNRYTRNKTNAIVKRINEIDTELYNYLSEKYGIQSSDEILANIVKQYIDTINSYKIIE